MVIIPTRRFTSTIVAGDTFVKLRSQFFVLKYGKHLKHHLQIESDVNKALLTSSVVMYFKIVKASCKRLYFPYIKASIRKITHNKSSELYTVFQLLDVPIYMALIEQNYVKFTYVISNKNCSINLNYQTEYLNANHIRSCNQTEVFL